MKRRHRRIWMLGCSTAGGAVDWAVLAVLCSLARAPAGLSAAAAALVGGLVNFALSRRLAFGLGRAAGWLAQLWRYLGLVVLRSAAWSGLLVHASAWLGLPYALGKAVAGLLVVSCWTIPVTSRLVFPKA